MTSSNVDNLAKSGNGNGHALSHWEPRRALSLDAARRHSTFIKYTRLALILFAGILGLMLMWYFLNVPKPQPQPDNPDETVKMIHPVYKGRTADGLPYRIIADEAIRFTQSPDDTKLVNPVLNFLRADDAQESMVVALSGLYSAETQILELHQDVHLNTDDGYDCKTSHARIFVKDKRIEGDETIACSGDFGKVVGNSFEINDNYTEFVFKGDMTARIVPEKETPILRGSHE